MASLSNMCSCSHAVCCARRTVLYSNKNFMAPCFGHGEDRACYVRRRTLVLASVPVPCCLVQYGLVQCKRQCHQHVRISAVLTSQSSLVHCHHRTGRNAPQKRVPEARLPCEIVQWSQYLHYELICNASPSLRSVATASFPTLAHFEARRKSSPMKVAIRPLLPQSRR